MQEHGRFQKQIEFAQSDRRRFDQGNAAHARKQVLNRGFRGGGMEHDLIGIFHAKGYGVTLLQNSLGNSLAIDENAELIPAVLQNILISFAENCRTVARNAAVGNRELISHFPAANRKWRFHKWDEAACVFGRNELENGFAGGWGVWHRT